MSMTVIETEHITVTGFQTESKLFSIHTMAFIVTALYSLVGGNQYFAGTH
jgi:hypothetical protein